MEITFVFWVDLEYRLRSRKSVSFAGFSCGDWHPILFLFLFLFYLLHILHDMLYMLPDYLTVGAYSVLRVWVVVPGMYGTHLKHRQHLQPISSNNLGSRLTPVIGVVLLVIHVTWPVIYVTWLPYGRALFSARSLGRGPEYVRNPLKTQTMPPTNQFQ